MPLWCGCFGHAKSSPVAIANGARPAVRQTVARWVRGGVITPITVTAGGQARFDMEQAKGELREHRPRDGAND